LLLPLLILLLMLKLLTVALLRGALARGKLLLQPFKVLRPMLHQNLKLLLLQRLKLRMRLRR